MNPWIEATRLRTLPASIAGVITGIACGIHAGGTHLGLCLLCLLFALLAQVASNFGNEYFDYRAGIDSKGREGFRRGVTEGDISPQAMLAATLGTLAAACLVGLVMMLLTGAWWLLPVGVVIALFALGYSAGPWPLSHHGLGDVAVVIFFGVVPVMLTSYLCCGAEWREWPLSLLCGLGMGFMIANILIVNNYRDADEDRAVGKYTTVVLLGRPLMSVAYLLGGYLAVGLYLPVWLGSPAIALVVPGIYLVIHTLLWWKMRRSSGAALNPLLGMTAMNLLLFALLSGSLMIMV